MISTDLFSCLSSIASCVVSFHLILSYLFPSCLVMTHLISSRLISSRGISSNHVSSCLIRFHHVSLCIIMSDNVSPCLFRSHHVSSFLIIPDHVSSCFMVSHHVSSCLIMSHYVSSCLIMSHHVSSSFMMSHRVSSCPIIFHHVSSYLFSMYQCISSYIYIYIIISCVVSCYHIPSVTSHPIALIFSPLLSSAIIFHSHPASSTQWKTTTPLHSFRPPPLGPEVLQYQTVPFQVLNVLTSAFAAHSAVDWNPTSGSDKARIGGSKSCWTDELVLNHHKYILVVFLNRHNQFLYTFEFRSWSQKNHSWRIGIQCHDSKNVLCLGLRTLLRLPLESNKYATCLGWPSP